MVDASAAALQLLHGCAHAALQPGVQMVPGLAVQRILRQPLLQGLLQLGIRLVGRIQTQQPVHGLFQGPAGQCRCGRHHHSGSGRVHRCSKACFW